ncbi:O-Glycosyl hydrolases family 17 protein [Perilla frutescens var. hirtella]|uniref:glucan endo-1,3-beta-D-glucosidase n=1 Tax=Perilla frutescens var. hirtella TaxID=608512 RepID=A0AAD4JJX1_PERFH|nr:O-Glycosyl hydrolases family 17 protein [Perilla frutescens var. hirtella]
MLKKADKANFYILVSGGTFIQFAHLRLLLGPGSNGATFGNLQGGKSSLSSSLSRFQSESVDHRDADDPVSSNLNTVSAFSDHLKAGTCPCVMIIQYSFGFALLWFKCHLRASHHSLQALFVMLDHDIVRFHDVGGVSSSQVEMSTVGHDVAVGGIGANWGSQSSHRLPPEIVVRMLRENGIQKVKLFDADYATLRALSRSGIQVMVGIPNDMLSDFASNSKAAEKWVSENVTHHLNNNVMIRYVAVGNEPFLETYNGSFLKTTFPALDKVQRALIKANLHDQVKVTVPLNADVYASASGMPSGGDFRTGIHDFMLPIVKLLSDNGAPFTVNIYPFISLYTDANFPVEYAFFDGSATPLNDGGTSYTNMFDANHDTLVWALQKNGFPNLPIIVGEIGWPTDGDRNANLQYAQRFNQGFMTHISGGRGTPMRSGPIDAYLFSLIDEDEKSIQPGNFERHWGIFGYDGQPKYPLNLGTSSSSLIGARNVSYLEQKWCIMKPNARLDDPKVAASVSYACSLGDCTCLGYQTSCGSLDARENISFAFNSYYQKNNQDDEACNFNGLATVTRADPTIGNCRFNLMIKPYYGGAGRVAGSFIKTLAFMLLVTITFLN